MVVASVLALGTERRTKLRQRKFFPSSHDPSGQMTGHLGIHAPHRVSRLRDNQVALAKRRCLSLEVYPVEMRADGQDCSVLAAEAWCGLTPSACAAGLRAAAISDTCAGHCIFLVQSSVPSRTTLVQAAPEQLT